MNDLVLAKIDRAKAFLAEAPSLQQVKEVIALAEAARVYAKRIGASIEVTNYAAADKHLGLPLSSSKPADASRLMVTATLLGAIASGEQPSMLSSGHGNPIQISTPVIPVVLSVDQPTLAARRIALASVEAMPPSEQRTRMAAGLRAQIARCEEELRRNGDEEGTVN
jgi:hypothetical protein